MAAETSVLGRQEFMRKLVIVVLALLFPLTLRAHVGSPDVYFDGYAGHYHLLVTVQPPRVIPGVAQIQIRSLAPGLREVKIVPMRIVGPGADLAPVADLAQRSATDPQSFAGKLWIMLRGSWKVRIQVEGDQGPGELAVPLPAVAEASLPMQNTLAALLLGLGLFLSIGLVTIVGAAAGEATLESGGAVPNPASRRRALLAETVTAVVVVAVLYLGNLWWRSEATRTAEKVYQLPHLRASLESGGHLLVQLQNPNAQTSELAKLNPEAIRLDDLVPDHGHLMHLFLIRLPSMDQFAHLHPQQLRPGVFAEDLPSLPAGRYEVFADIVHRTAFPETQMGEIELPAIAGKPLLEDDSEAAAMPASSSDTSPVAQLPDGCRMILHRDTPFFKAGQFAWLRFRVEDKKGKLVTDLEPYLGMAAHAALLRSDSSVFAHLHPAGSVSMAALALANGGAPSVGEMNGMPMPISSEVSFPYGFPKPGRYRIFVEVKRNQLVETGVFDLTVL